MMEPDELVTCRTMDPLGTWSEWPTDEGANLGSLKVQRPFNVNTFVFTLKCQMNIIANGITTVCNRYKDYQHASVIQ